MPRIIRYFITRSGMGISLFWNITFISALSQGLFVTIILLVQYLRTRHLSQLILGIFLLVFSQILLNNIIYWNQLLGEHPHFIFSTVSTRFLLAPLFYLYCRTFLQRTFKRKDVLHFLPFIVLTTVYSPLLLLSGSEKKELASQLFSQQEEGVFHIGSLINWLLALQLIIYAAWIFYEVTIKKKLGGARRQHIRWLTFLNSLFFVYGALMLMYFILVWLQIGGIQKDFYISAVMCLAIYSISYVGMVTPNLLKGEDFLNRIQQPKYRRTPLKKAYLEEVIGKLEQLMRTERLYLTADISLQEIAEQLAISRHHISQALSVQLDRTFHEYINAYRVAHAQELLSTLPSDENIKMVMYASGFNNRASFNNNFKKFTGMTATAFLKQKQISAGRPADD